MTDWTPLATGDPLPGDPAATAHLGRRFDDLADALGQHGGRVAEVEPERVWHGLAARRFAAARDQVPGRLRALARRCGLAGDALAAWSRDMETAQATGLVLRDVARQAEQDVIAAQAGVAAMRGHDRHAAATAGAWNAANPDLPPRSPAPWTGPDWPAMLQDAQLRLARAQRDFDDLVAGYRDDARRAATRLEDADEVLDDPVWAVGPVASMLARMVGAPGEHEFVVTDDGLVLNTREGWQWEAYQQAGIDPHDWDPSRGLAALDDVAVNAWELYADLFDRNPDQFLWAGMATLAGGTFYAAFQDLHVLRRGLEDGSVTVDEVGDVLRRLYPGMPGQVLDELVDLAARDVAAFAADVRYVETEFLDMQRQIFDDLAWQHLAYEQGGLEAMEALWEREEILDVHIGAWRSIDTGDYADVAEGNAALLRHEQEGIIGDDYDGVRGHSPITWLMTMGMSVVAHSPVPGGRPFRDVVPYEVVVDTPDRLPVVPDWAVPDRVPGTGLRIPGGEGIHLDTPDEIGLVDLPLNNVSAFDKRWQWIEQDMLPTWLGHVEQGTASALVSWPIAEQAAGQRLIPDRLLPYEPE